MGTYYSSKKNLLIAFLILSLILGFVWQFFPLKDASNRLDSLPLTGSTFIGSVIPLNSQEIQYLHKVDLIKRKYQVGNQSLYLYVLDGTRNRHAIHDPTYCFRGGGWQITDRKPFFLPGGTASLFTISKDNVQKQALLWFSNGSNQFSSPWKYWLDTTMRRLTLGHWSAEPVLVIIIPASGQSLNWKQVIHDFPNLLRI